MSEDTSGYVKMISPQDYRIYSVPSGQRDAYVKAGYVAPQSEINTSEIHSHFNGWAGTGKSFLLSTVAGVPFARSAIAGLSTQEQAKAWQEDFDAAAREHPYLDFAGKTVGLVGSVAGLAAGAGALGVAGGVGAAAAGGTAEAGALGVGAAEAVGGASGALEAGGVAAAAAGTESAGLAGVAGAANTAGTLTAQTLGQGAATFTGAAAKGAAVNAALGSIARLDDAALAHAADPEGKEKIVFDLNSTLFDAAIGAALPATLGGLGKTLGYVGKKLGNKGVDLMQDSLTKAAARESIERQGRTGDLTAKLEEVVAAGRKNPSEYVKSRIKVAENDIENLKASNNYATLGKADTDAVKAELRQTLGKNNRIYRKLQKFLSTDGFVDKATGKAVKGTPAWSIDDMQEINRRIYKAIAFDEPGLRRGENDQYLKAADIVKKGMLKVMQDNDLTVGQEQSQKFATALKEYSDWELTRSAIKRGEGPKGTQDILKDVFAGGATGFLTGGLFGSFGGALPAAAGGAGYKAVTNINAYHYGKAVELLGKAFGSIDKRLTTAVEAGLYGAPALAHKLHSEHSYQDIASKVSAARANPQRSFTNLRTALAAANMPESVGDDVALAQHTQIQWLASKMPGRTTAPDVSSKGQADPVAQRRFIGQVRTMQDPTYGIAYPTRSNMEVLQKFYPYALNNAQQAILSQVQRNPNLPASSKHWASKVLGRPLNNLSSPSFSSMLQTARQQAEQVAQQGPGGPSPKRSQPDSFSSQTRLDELQNG